MISKASEAYLISLGFEKDVITVWNVICESPVLSKLLEKTTLRKLQLLWAEMKQNNEL